MSNAVTSRRDSFDLVSTTRPLPKIFTPRALHPKGQTTKHEKSGARENAISIASSSCVILGVVLFALGLLSWMGLTRTSIGLREAGSIVGFQDSVWVNAVLAVQVAIFIRLAWAFAVWPYDALIRELGDLHCGAWMVC